MTSTTYIEFIFTGPPDPNRALTLIKVVDDRGNEVKVGEFYHDGQFWRYQVPVELVPRMVLPRMDDGCMPLSTLFPPARAVASVGGMTGPVAPKHLQPDPQSARRALRDRVTSLPRKEPPTSMAPNPSPKSEWELCSNCQQRFDPREHELLDCPNCGEQRCTAQCMPNPTEPCLDCQALQPDPDDGGPEKVKLGEAAPAGVFDPGFSPNLHAAVRAKGGMAENEEEDEDND